MIEVRRQAVAVARAIGELRRMNARGARVDENADAAVAVSSTRSGDRGVESVLAEPDPGQPVVAAFPARQSRRQRFVEPIDFTDPAIELGGLESTLAQSAALRSERADQRIASATEGRGHGPAANGERIHGNERLLNRPPAARNRRN